MNNLTFTLITGGKCERIKWVAMHPDMMYLASIGATPIAYTYSIGAADFALTRARWRRATAYVLRGCCQGRVKRNGKTWFMLPLPNAQKRPNPLAIPYTRRAASIGAHAHRIVMPKNATRHRAWISRGQ